MYSYQVSFVGREKNTFGCIHPINLELQALNPQELKQKLSAEYVHITNLKIIELEFISELFPGTLEQLNNLL